MKTIIESYKDIEGWFDFEEIYDTIYNGLPENGCFVEVGSFKGKSTAYFAEKLKKDKSNKVFVCVDTWQGTEGEHEEMISKLDKPLIEIFEENMSDLGLSDYICPIEKDSVEAAKDFIDKSVDVVFLDGDHSYEGVKADIEAWLPKIKPGGLLCGHDIDFPFVWRAVKEKLKDFHVIQRCWIKYV